MNTHLHLSRLAPLSALVLAAVAVLLAVPAGATIVCRPGATPPSPYCENVQPTARTDDATGITGSSATLNGHSGAAVKGGDPTSYFFQYGETSDYGLSTPTGTLGSCEPGHTPPSTHCSTPDSQAVSAAITGLAPCTQYHFRIVSSNPDGITDGADRRFATGFANPVAKVKAPHKAKPHRKFKVTISLRLAATVKIVIRRHGHTLKSTQLGTVGPGTVSRKIKAPHRAGRYTLRIVAKLPCAQQTVGRHLIVKRRHGQRRRQATRRP